MCGSCVRHAAPRNHREASHTPAVSPGANDVLDASAATALFLVHRRWTPRRRVEMMHDENTLVAERMESTLRAAHLARIQGAGHRLPETVAAARRATGVYFALLGVSVAAWAA